MSAIEKLKKKKKTKAKSSKANIRSHTDEAPLPLEKPAPVPSPVDQSSVSSVISVREASAHDQTDNIQGKRGPRQGTDRGPTTHDSSRPGTAHGPAVSSPQPGPSTDRDGQSGSRVSVKSKEAWTNDEKTDPVKPDKGSRPITAASSHSQVENFTFPLESDVSDYHNYGAMLDEGLFGSANMNEAHAYVPYLYARDTIAKMMADMKKMKSHHVLLVTQIEQNYTHIEDETQGQFNTFVLNLRQNYGKKVKTFRQVIELHRMELQQKQDYWDEALMSLSAKNKQLLNDKKKLLIKNKIDCDNLETEKEEGVKDFRVRYEETNRELLEIKAKHREELRQREKDYEDEKDKEIQHMEQVMSETVERERAEAIRLHLIIDELNKKPDTAAAISVATAVVAMDSSRPSTANKNRRESSKLVTATVAAPMVVITDLSDDERRRIEEERRKMREERDQMQAERQEMEREMEKFNEERKAFNDQKLQLQQDILLVEKDRDIWKAKYTAQKARLEDLSNLKKKYDLLRARFDAAVAVACVNTQEERDKAEDKIEKAEQDKLLMEEEKRDLDLNITKWEKSFNEQHRRQPAESDRTDSKQELYQSRDEADHMVQKLDAQIETIRALMRGEVPAPPAVEPEKVPVTEPEITVVEVMVPDRETQAELDMTRTELEALKRQLLALRSELSKQKDEKAVVIAELSEVQHEVTRLEATRAELEKRLTEALSELERLKLARPGLALVGGADTAELERKLKETQAELRTLEVRHKEELGEAEVEHNKEKNSLEKTVKKLEKDLAKLEKKLSGRSDIPDDSELEKQIEKLEDRVMELELEVKDITADRNHFSTTNNDKKLQIAELQKNLSGSEDKAIQLHTAATLGDTAQAQLSAAHEELEQLRAKVKDLSQKELELREELSKKEQKHEKLKSDMEKDMKKMLKEIARLRNKLKETTVPVLEPAKEEEKTDKLEDKIIDLEHKVATLEADSEHLNSSNKTLKDRLNTRDQELSSAEKRNAELAASAAALETIQAQLVDVQVETDDLKQRVKDLEDQLREKDRELREREREHEHSLWEREKAAKEMQSDIRKLLKQMKKLKDKLKAAEGYKAECDALRLELEASHGDVPEAKPDTDNSELQDKIAALEDNILAVETERDHLKDANKEAESRADDLANRLVATEEKIHGLQAAAAAQSALEGLQLEVEALRRQIKAKEEQLRDKQQEVGEKQSEINDRDREMRTMETTHQEQLREKDKNIKEVEKDIRKLLKHMAKLKVKLGEGQEVSVDKEVDQLEDKVTDLEKVILDLQGQNQTTLREKQILEKNNKTLEYKVEQLKEELAAAEAGPVIPLTVSTPLGSSPPTADVLDLTQQIEDLQQEIDSKEVELREEVSNHDLTREELESANEQLASLKVDCQNLKDEAKITLDAAEAKLNAEIENLKQKLTESEDRVEASEAARLSGVPPDTAGEIKDLKDKLKLAEKEKDDLKKVEANLSGEVKILQAKLASLEKSSSLQKTTSAGNENKLKQIKAEKDNEIKKVQAAADKKEKQRADQERKKITALEQKIRTLEAGGGTAVPGRAKSAIGRGDSKALQGLQDKLRDAKKENSELNSKIRQLEGDLKRGGGPSTGGGPDIETNRQMKKQEKILRELEKILDIEKKKSKNNEENIRKLEQELTDAQKSNKDKDNQIERLKAQLATLGASAEQAALMAKEIKKLKTENKKMADDNKQLSDNFNSERVLRKKYYNMVEDMKGKIRVYARVRPMSKGELSRGNTDVTKSPDEYSVSVTSSRGLKEFQFDTVFMPDSTQEKVFEDTNNLIQSAVDGYNVCIFAYGQTGSGKTFTIIGDGEQKLPGIAPRAFKKIYELLDENKSKFSYKVSCYMMELYNDKLLDLFSKNTSRDAESREKLEIKKDKKGMVVVQGAEVKAARNAKELSALFEEGSKTRHTASTKMNDESSRSHLVIGIIIETTNKSTGSVMKGKLSLVDLAGSERAAKTEASAEQLKEAMSINKSLSALGDVISALSSEQQFIPYRNNKLTMLMQDSLGGNAKTLMFVNISPADYNCDESVVSLTYASRVKLITNDAQKNLESKEISRLRAMIAKMKKGDSTVEEEG